MFASLENWSIRFLGRNVINVYLEVRILLEANTLAFRWSLLISKERRGVGVWAAVATSIFVLRGLASVVSALPRALEELTGGVGPLVSCSTMPKFSKEGNGLG